MSNRFSARSIALLIAAATVALACLAAATIARAQASFDDAELDLSNLQTQFWDCDARATQEVLSAGDGARCVDIHEALKRRQFDGDFDAMLMWWRERREYEHGRRIAPAVDPAVAAAAEAGEAAMQAP